MKRFLFLGLLLFAFFNGEAQNVAIGIPDSVENVAFPGSTGAYTISNPLNHNGTSFTNAPIAGNCFMNCKSDYLYFHDFGLNIPPYATILGFEIVHTRGGCNQGSFVIDTLHLTLNGTPIGTAKRDSASATETDTLGGSVDDWGIGFVPPLLVTNADFGVMIRSTGTGICTFGQFDLRLKVYYCEFGTPNQGIPDSVVNVAFSGSSGTYSVTNPLAHNGTQFTNPPVTVNCVMNCKSDWLYFHNFGFNVPSGQMINGIEVVHSRGGCNSGSFVIDTLSLAYGGLPIGNLKRDSTSNMTTDTLGDLADVWGNAGLNGAMVSDPSFGVMVRSSGTGICTFGQFDLRVNVYFCGENVLSSEPELNSTIVFYPNPATDRIHWTHPETVSRVVCLNALGQTVGAPQMGDGLDVSRLSNGIYFMRVTRVDGALETKRVMVQH
ncbi:MAG: hypothetical protein RLZZ519_208 [Bacteroidota bacterium]|jgi:hypothetical protein